MFLNLEVTVLQVIWLRRQKERRCERGGRGRATLVIERDRATVGMVGRFKGCLGISSHLGILSPPIPCRMTRVTLPHTVTSHHKEI